MGTRSLPGAHPSRRLLRSLLSMRSVFMVGYESRPSTIVRYIAFSSSRAIKTMPITDTNQASVRSHAIPAT